VALGSIAHKPQPTRQPNPALPLKKASTVMAAALQTPIFEKSSISLLA